METEAYPAGCPRVPRASHGPGSTFVYSIYGVTNSPSFLQIYIIHIKIITIIKVNKCLNISSEETGACVLLRAARPLHGLEVTAIISVIILNNFHHFYHHQQYCHQQARLFLKVMHELRKRPGLKEWEVCKGPGNLCRLCG